MPIYEYRCKVCGKINEVLILHKDNTDEIVCDECGCRDLEKIISATHFAFADGSAGSSHCGKDTTCCGSSTPCDSRPCKS